MLVRRFGAVVIAAALLLTGCSAGQHSGSSSSSGSGAAGSPSGTATGDNPAPSPSASSGSVGLTMSPADATTGVRPDTPVTVSVTGGTLRSVSLTAAQPALTLTGSLDSGATAWHNTDALASGRSYTLAVKATGSDGVEVVKKTTFTTKEADSIVSSVLIPGDDEVVGVGMPVIVTFSQSVKNRKAAEAALIVTATPSVEGSWKWMSSREVHWRPKEFWPAGTKVFVKAATSGVELSPGAWGKRTVTSKFSIGKRQISTVDIAAHSLTVTQDGATVRTIPVTTGMPGFRTRGGTKVIMEKLPQVRMDAATTGTDPKDPNYYNILVYWAMRLTYSGEFLHAAPWSVGSQGHANVSHGCTGMSTDNARWLFNFSQVGDVVQYKNGQRALEWGNGYTEWNESFDDWSTTAA